MRSGATHWGRGLAGRLALAVMAAFVVSRPAAADDISNVRVGTNGGVTRVVIELDRATRGQVIDGLTGAGTFGLALTGLDVQSERKGGAAGLVKGWSVDGAAGAARLKFDLVSGAQLKRRFLIPPADGVSVYRYVIDFETPAPAAPTPSVAVQARLQAAPPTSVAVLATPPVAKRRSVAQAETVAGPPAAATAGTPLSWRRRVVVIDAGHGGHDPGALGARSREKDVNLAAARTLRGLLERSGRYRVVMTRDSDVFVPLEQRVAIARKADADLFISLHSDSGPDPSVHGATVYTLSDKGSDRVARNVMSQNDWFINVNLPGKDKAVNQILLDLQQRATRNHSAAFAEEIVNHIGEPTLTRRGHRDAGFVVLLAPDVPAVLFEMGFITSPADERTLNDPDERERLMGSLASSIDSYFDAQTRIASR